MAFVPCRPFCPDPINESDGEPRFPTFRDHTRMERSWNGNDQLAGVETPRKAAPPKKKAPLGGRARMKSGSGRPEGRGAAITWRQFRYRNQGGGVATAL